MTTLADEDRDLLDALVGFHEIRGSEWRTTESSAWHTLVEAGMVAWAPGDYVYPLSSGIRWIRRSRAKRVLDNA